MTEAATRPEQRDFGESGLKQAYQRLGRRLKKPSRLGDPRQSLAETLAWVLRLGMPPRLSGDEATRRSELDTSPGNSTVMSDTSPPRAGLCRP